MNSQGRGGGGGGDRKGDREGGRDREGDSAKSSNKSLNCFSLLSTDAITFFMQFLFLDLQLLGSGDALRLRRRCSSNCSKKAGLHRLRAFLIA